MIKKGKKLSLDTQECVMESGAASGRERSRDARGGSGTENKTFSRFNRVHTSH